MKDDSNQGGTAHNEGEEKLKVTEKARWRSADVLDRLTGILKQWYKYYDEFHPGFHWWVSAPYNTAVNSLQDYAKLLRHHKKGKKEKADRVLVGHPIGRDALLTELDHEMLTYTPEELIKIGNRELAWCESELKKTAKEMGFKKWKEALEHIKGSHARPGEQDDLVAGQVEDVIRFLEKYDLITIPDLCRETWHISMIDEKRQKMTPFAFYGYQVMSIAFASRSMEHEDKLMSMRANNIHFMKVVTAHELIPGHHLQSFMAARFNTHRRIFGTPFFIEGWALYWEMLLWDKGYHSSHEDKIGMLFWRINRCARIIVSLMFHLDRMTPNKMIKFLIDRVGHEKASARAEVKRFIKGNYSPLYQCSYMVGALQLRALSKEFVSSGKMTEKQFHDVILKAGPIPVEMIRAGLKKVPIEKNYRPQWKFYDF